MNIVFAGTPIFAAHALQAILNAGFKVPLVLTQPDRPSGRGLKLTSSPVKQVAITHNIAVEQPTSLKLGGEHPIKAKATREIMERVKADVMVVAAYGLILPNDVLSIPRYGCINIHASLLPRWRGAAPIHRAIEAGDTTTGITLMKMDAGLDTGNILAVESCAILPQHTTALLHDELAIIGANMIVSHLTTLSSIYKSGGSAPQGSVQPTDGVTYANKINKSESLLNWQACASVLERKIRAFDPAPGCIAKINNTLSFKIWAAQVVSDAAHSHLAGTILKVDKYGIDVACGSGVLRITQAQKAGAKRLPVEQFLNGFELPTGLVLLS